MKSAVLIGVDFMRRNDEQAELMKRRNADTKSSGASGQMRALLRRRPRIGTLLCFALIALHGLALSAQGQKPAPKTVSVDVAKPLTQPLQYRFAGKGPQPETELDFKGDGQNWRFVYFDKLPEHVTLKVKDAPVGYQDSELLRPERWYPFKKMLPVLLETAPE